MDELHCLVGIWILSICSRHRHLFHTQRLLLTRKHNFSSLSWKEKSVPSSLYFWNQVSFWSRSIFITTSIEHQIYFFVFFNVFFSSFINITNMVNTKQKETKTPVPRVPPSWFHSSFKAAPHSSILSSRFHDWNEAEENITPLVSQHISPGSRPAAVRVVGSVSSGAAADCCGVSLCCMFNPCCCLPLLNYVNLCPLGGEKVQQGGENSHVAVIPFTLLVITVMTAMEVQPKFQEPLKRFLILLIVA